MMLNEQNSNITFALVDKERKLHMFMYHTYKNLDSGLYVGHYSRHQKQNLLIDQQQC